IVGLLGAFGELRKLVLAAPTPLAQAPGAEQLRILDHRAVIDEGGVRWLARCPRLEQLLVAGVGVALGVDPLRALHAPRKLRVAQAANAVEMIAQSAGMRRLESLELVGLGDGDIDALGASATAFQHLRTFLATIDVPLGDGGDEAVGRLRRVRERLPGTIN